MSKVSKFYWIALIILWLTAMWYWADDNDYYRDNFRYMTKEQKLYFNWQNGESEEDFKNKYRQHFNDTSFFFPRQQVVQIKRFKNTPLLGLFTGKSLKHEKLNEFLSACNDTLNYNWAETTWNESEAQYYVRFYNANNQVCGKMYLELTDGNVEASPFCPVTRFGSLSPEGLKKMNDLITTDANWQ
ncbi:MAG: hypothetical protein IT236_05725 [Bacteroidia bacterium]|nr:hypothetical protein [Bacteroidia bacterium]